MKIIEQLQHLRARASIRLLVLAIGREVRRTENGKQCSRTHTHVRGRGEVSLFPFFTFLNEKCQLELIENIHNRFGFTGREIERVRQLIQKCL